MICRLSVIIQTISLGYSTVEGKQVGCVLAVPPRKKVSRPSHFSLSENEEDLLTLVAQCN